MANIFKSLKKAVSKVERKLRPVTKLAIAGTAIYYGASWLGAAGATKLGAAYLVSRGGTKAEPSPESPAVTQSELMYGGYAPYSNPADYSYSGGVAGSQFAPEFDATPERSPWVSPLFILGGVAVAGLFIFLLLRK